MKDTLLKPEAPEQLKAESGSSAPTCSALCKFCGGEIAIRNPTGSCDHLYWPDMLTDEAKIANGFRKVMRESWEQNIQIIGERSESAASERSAGS